jgi:hypothetical protein
MNKPDPSDPTLPCPDGNVKHPKWTPESIERIEAHTYWLLAIAVAVDHHCAIPGYLLISALKFTKLALKQRAKNGR